jgi:phosphoglycerate dehydrogenase-like enzyme
MPVTVAMYDKGYDYIGKRLDALGLDIKIATFSKDGQYKVDGVAVAPGAVDVDYLWLNSNINLDQFQAGAFEIALATRSVKVMQTFNAGLDHPFYKKMSDKGTRICNSSAQGIAISEYVMAQVLSVVHPVESQRALQLAKTWKTTPFRELSQMTWLIVGFGPIGQEVAKRAKAFGAKTNVIRRSPTPSPLADKIGTMADLNTLAGEADVIVLACALNAETRGFADAAFFGAVKEGAILVNVARGALIDDAAMIGALDKDRLATAILDVFHEEPLPPSHPLWTHPKVRLTSHTSFAGSGVRGRWDALFLDNIARFVTGADLVNEVKPRDLA